MLPVCGKACKYFLKNTAFTFAFVLFELGINLPPFPVHDSREEICQIALVLMRYVCEGYIELSGFVHKSLPFAHWEELYVFNKLQKKKYIHIICIIF